MRTASRPALRKPGARALALAAVVLGTAGFAGANAHLIYVAVTTQPDCVTGNATVTGEAPRYRAAKRAC